MTVPRAPEGPDAELAAVLRRRDAAEVIAVQSLLGAIEHGLFGRSPDPVKVGRFIVVRRLGAGGSGTVYEAYDPELERQVALKLLFGESADHRELLAREARAMARLAHPNVVAVHDVGLHDDPSLSQPTVFLVMERVRGADLARWLHATARRSAEILGVLLQAGRGLVAAHAAGLIHRDFKPANVLVGDDHRVRVSDFGLALPAVCDAANTSRPVGTAAYMAPELLRGGASDARSDQFAFCVVARDALVGAHRGALPRAVHAAIERGLATDPAARFGSMAELLAAIDRPFVARRRRRIVGAALVVVGIGAAGLALRSHVQAKRCDDAGAAIEADWDDATQQRIGDALRDPDGPAQTNAYAVVVIDGWVDDWRAAAQTVCRRALVERTDDDAWRSASAACLAAARLRMHVVRDLLASGEVRGAAADVVAILEPPATCLDDEPIVLAISPSDELLRALATANASRAAVHLEDARAEAELARRLASREGQPVLEVEALLVLGRAERESDRRLAAIAALLSAAALAETAGDTGRVLRAQAWLALALADGGELAESERWISLVEARMQREQPRALWAAEVAFVAGQVHHARGKNELAIASHEDALGRYEAVLGPVHPSLTGPLQGLGMAYGNLGRDDEADVALERALSITESTKGAQHPSAAAAHNALGANRLRAGDPSAAIAEFEQARSIYADVLGPTHSRTLGVAANLAAALADAGRSDAAIAAFRDLCDAQRDAVGEHDPRHATALHNLGWALARVGDHDEAVATLRRASELRREMLGADHADTIQTNDALARALADQEAATTERRRGR